VCALVEHVDNVLSIVNTVKHEMLSVVNILALSLQTIERVANIFLFESAQDRVMLSIVIQQIEIGAWKRFKCTCGHEFFAKERPRLCPSNKCRKVAVPKRASVDPGDQSDSLCAQTLETRSQSS
jgi:hypothetical protein